MDISTLEKESYAPEVCKSIAQIFIRVILERNLRHQRNSEEINSSIRGKEEKNASTCFGKHEKQLKDTRLQCFAVSLNWFA